MPVPIICMDGRLRHFAAAFRDCFSTPQHRYFEIVLLALLLCQEAKTLSGLLRQVAARLGPEPPAALPIDAMTEEEWKILDTKQDWE